ncbi:MAG: hypothetical protein IKV43_03320, partial [Clostridia bacterium]|nr:hypothetical protein [Clostridia bacterium]
MSKVYVKIEFHAEWLAKHKVDFVHPSVVIGDFVTKKFASSVTVNKESASAIILVVDTSAVSAEDVVAFVAGVIEQQYEENPEEAITASLDGEAKEPATPSIGKLDSDDGKTKLKLNGDSSGDDDGPFGKLRLFGRDDAAPTAGDKRNEELEKLLEEIRTTPGNIEFLPLAEEVARMAPLAIRTNTKDVFLYQSYLFSINDGYGLERYVAQLTKLLSVTGLIRFSGSDGISYFTVTDGESMHGCLEKVVEARNSSPLVAVIDISEKMTDLNVAEVRKFFNLLAALKTSNVVY